MWDGDLFHVSKAFDNGTLFFEVLDEEGNKVTEFNIEDISNALDIVNQVGGKLFDWTDEYINQHGGLDGYFVRKEDFGVIAQDLLEVFPRAVRQRDDGTLAVDYEKLCALAFAAIKELKSEIDELKGNK